MEGEYMRHECNCEYCEYVEDEYVEEQPLRGMSLVLEQIGDPSLRAMWQLRKMYSSAPERRQIESGIIERIGYLRAKRATDVVKKLI